LEILWETGKIVLRHNILLFIRINGFSLIIVKLASTGFSYYFSRIIEKDTCTEVWQKISKSILWRIINPLCNPHLCCLVDVSATFNIWGSWTGILSIVSSFDRITSYCSSWTFLTYLDWVLFASFALRIRSDWDWSYLVINLWHLVWSGVPSFTSFSEMIGLIWSVWSITTIHSWSLSQRIRLGTDSIFWTSHRRNGGWWCWLAWSFIWLSHKLSNILSWRNAS